MATDAEIDAEARAYMGAHDVSYAEAVSTVAVNLSGSGRTDRRADFVESHSDIELHERACRIMRKTCVSYVEAINQVVTAFSAFQEPPAPLVAVSGASLSDHETEAFIVPLSRIGAIFFPIAGVALWHGGRPSGKRMGCVGLAMMILIFVLVLLLVSSGTLLLSYLPQERKDSPEQQTDEKTSMWQFSRLFDHELKSGEQLDFDGDWRRQLPVWHQVDGRDPLRVTPEESVSLAFKTAAQDSMDAYFSEGQFGKFDGMKVTILPPGSWETMSPSQLMELAITEKIAAGLYEV